VADSPFKPKKVFALPVHIIYFKAKDGFTVNQIL
jgi:hypothetical protein